MSEKTCACGCGEIVRRRFVHGHNRRGPHIAPIRTLDMVLAMYEQITESGCWIFTGKLTESGYARLQLNGRTARLHRLFYEHFVGPIPPGLVPDHLCRVRCCLRPDHIEIVTMRENTLRGQGPTAQFAKRDRCSSGHVYTATSMQLRDGRRICRICERERESRRGPRKRFRRQSENLQEAQS